MNNPDQGDDAQNIMLLARKKPGPIPLAWDDALRTMLAKEWKKPIPDDTPALRDDYAPVERYAMPMLRARGL